MLNKKNGILRLCRRGLIALCVWSLACMAYAQVAGTDDVLTHIRQRSRINIGVKTDFPPFGMLDSEGKPKGVEVDLAREMARRLGVEVNIVSVTTENRLQKLEQGSVDMLIATVADTAERRKAATVIEPDYYAGGVSLFMRPEQRFDSWASVRGQKLCATQSAYFNRPMSERYLLDLQMYKNTRDALMALRDGRCVGYLYSSVAIEAYLADPDWQGYRAPLPVAMIAPWGIMIPRNAKGSPYELAVSDIVADWHRSGYLIGREKAWAIKPTKFLSDMRTIWSTKDEEGQFLCNRNAGGSLPSQCRNQTFVKSSEVTGLQKIGLWLREKSGLDISYVYDRYDRARFIKGLCYTILLILCAMLGSLGSGYVAARLCDGGGPAVNAIVKGVAMYGKMAPPLLQMYLLFFGVGSILWELCGASLPAFFVAVLCMCFNAGATVMNILLDTVAYQRSQDPYFRLCRHTLVQTVDLSSAALKTVMVNMTKQSMIASAIAVPEVLSVVTSIMADQGNMGVMMNTLLVVFLLLVSMTDLILNWLEKRLHDWQVKQHERG